MSEPTCLYYAHLACAKPKLCPVHGPILRRPFKKRHSLREDRWGQVERRMGLHSLGPELLTTRCGLLLHDIVDISKMTLPEYFEVSREPYYHHAPEPSTDPAYTIYYQLGYSRREVLVANQAVATCGRCL